MRKDIVWDLKGEGRILGGVFVVGPGEQGILLDHLAKDFGDEVDPKDVMTAVEKINREFKIRSLRTTDYVWA